METEMGTQLQSLVQVFQSPIESIDQSQREKEEGGRKKFKIAGERKAQRKSKRKRVRIL